MAAFLNGLSVFYKQTTAFNGSIPECKSDIDHVTYYQYSLIPAMTIVILLACTKTRRNVLLNALSGRPGLLYPMDFLTRTSRISYMCGFGATALLVHETVWNGKMALNSDSSIAVKSIIVIVSMVIYGLVYFPIFACLAVKTAFSFGIVSLHVWTITVIDIYRMSECDFNLKGRFVTVIRYMPILLCDVYLSISFPIRFGVACRDRRFFTSEEDMEEKLETLEEIRESFQGQHVTNLLTTPVIPVPPTEFADKARAAFFGFLKRWVYHSESGFRFPSRLLSVLFVSGITVYLITIQFMAMTINFLDSTLDFISGSVELLGGWDATVSGDQELVIEGFKLAYHLSKMIRICLILSISLAFAFTLLTICHMLSCYRTNLYAMYRGDYRMIPSPDEKSAASLCVGNIKFAGYQVAYLFWSYVIVVVVLFLISFSLACVFSLLAEGYTDWLLNKIFQIWPSVLIGIALFISQTLLAKHFFLQGDGQHLRLDNRRFVFIFTYFMFFYNIFLGLVSCLLRIIKAIVIGVMFLSRLDNSTLPRRFEFFDPGFNAYQGFIHMEAAHTHPVVLVFIRLLATLSKQRRAASAKQASRNHRHNGAQPVDDNTLLSKQTSRSSKVGVDPDRSPRPVNVAARFNWHVVYTLLNNPQIRMQRKGFIQSITIARKKGIRIGISDLPITEFDLVKAVEDNDKEQQRIKDDQCETRRRAKRNSRPNSAAANDVEDHGEDISLSYSRHFKNLFKMPHIKSKEVEV